jgi:long-chain acyl-CoA synthetase
MKSVDYPVRFPRFRTRDHQCEPREVEEALLSHPDVREVSAIGAPDPDWGEIVVACVVLEDGVTADDGKLDAHCLQSIARFKRPKRYVLAG